MSNLFGWLTPPGCGASDTGPMGEDDYRCEVCGRTCTQEELDSGEDDPVCRECKALREEEVATMMVPAHVPKVSHTPGKWEVGGPFPSVSVVVCVAGSGVDEPPIYEPICIVDSRTTGVPDQQALADAHLIAAAPALLEALEGFIALCNSGAIGSTNGDYRETGTTLYKKAQAALALARGGVK